MRLDATLSQLAERAEDLTEFAWAFRYPGEQEEPAGEEAEAALSLAREVFQAVQIRLPEEVRL